MEESQKKKISELPATTEPSATGSIPISQGGETYRLNPKDLPIPDSVQQALLAYLIAEGADVLINQNLSSQEFKVGGSSNRGMIWVRKFFNRIGFGIDGEDTVDKEFDVNLESRFRKKVEFDGGIEGNINSNGQINTTGNQMSISSDGARSVLNRPNFSGTVGFDFKTDDLYDWVFGMITGESDRLRFNSRLGGDTLVMTTNNKVGINASDPTHALHVASDTIRIDQKRTIANANDTGLQGEICYDDDYLYVCVSANTWKRVSLSTW